MTSDPDFIPQEKQKKNWTFRLGVFLVIISIPFFLSLTLIPFLNLEGRTKVVLSTVALITGEVTFWAGGILVGKEFFGKVKKFITFAKTKPK